MCIIDRLRFAPDGRPMLQVFSTCKHFIRTLPNLVYDESNVEAVSYTHLDVYKRQAVSGIREHRPLQGVLQLSIRGGQRTLHLVVSSFYK